MWLFRGCHVTESYLIFIIHRVQMTVFTMIIQIKLYRQLYFETFDNMINCIKDRFNQTDYKIYEHLQEILINAFK